VLDANVTTAPPLISAPPVLSLSEVQAFYGKAQILFDLSLRIEQGQVVAIIGANGAGKSTTLNAIIGRITPAAGEVKFEGVPIHGMRVEEIVARGITCVPQRRRIFATMTVLENLEVGAYTRRKDKVLIRRGLEEAFELFPVLNRKQNDLGGYLSGGEQQMLAIARGLMSAPKILLLDEPSMGLSPKLTTEMFQSIQRIAQQGRTIVIVEQNAYAALAASSFGYVLENGRVALSGDAETLLADDYVRQMYLGA
jgi:branched-chain amino acid transport system ATP-binding protein